MKKKQLRKELDLITNVVVVLAAVIHTQSESAELKELLHAVMETWEEERKKLEDE